MTEPAQGADVAKQHLTPSVAVGRHVARRASAWQQSLLDRGHRDRARTVALLARLRRGSADDPGDPRLWEATLADLPDQLHGRGDEPGRAERAIHASLVLVAIHFQSANGPRHVSGRRLGLAMGELARVADAQDPSGTAAARRFQTFATATAWSQRLHHLRGLVTLLRANDIALDHGALARDLYQSQTSDGLRRARLQWGRDFHFLPRDPTYPSDATVQNEES